MKDTAKRGRPPGKAAVAHQDILDSVSSLLEHMSARDLTMDAIALHAGVGKQTLYKWWPSKTALIMSMFQERLIRRNLPLQGGSVEMLLRSRVHYLIDDFNALFGKVIAELIAEGQSQPEILHELRKGYLDPRRDHIHRSIEHGMSTNEFRRDTNAAVLMDSLFAPLYHRLLLGYDTLTHEFGDALVEQVMRGVLLATEPRMSSSDHGH